MTMKFPFNECGNESRLLLFTCLGLVFYIYTCVGREISYNITYRFEEEI